MLSSQLKQANFQLAVLQTQVTCCLNSNSRWIQVWSTFYSEVPRLASHLKFAFQKSQGLSSDTPDSYSNARSYCSPFPLEPLPNYKMHKTLKCQGDNGRNTEFSPDIFMRALHNLGVFIFTLPTASI